MVINLEAEATQQQVSGLGGSEDRAQCEVLSWAACMGEALSLTLSTAKIVKLFFQAHF